MTTAPADTILTPPAIAEPSGRDQRVYRHRWPVRLWHWANALTLLILLMSGLMIFNAHPRLYWGDYGANADPAWMEIGSIGTQGYLRVGTVEIATTGMLGRWRDADGQVRRRAFPYWATIPSAYNLADGRRWHLFFAWVFALTLSAFMLWSLVRGHLRHDLHIKRSEWAWRNIWQDIKDHARLRFPTGEAAAHYHILQKLSYNGVIFILLPLMIATGLAMSPGINAAAPWLTDLLGGRQSARSWHFIAAFALVGFFVVHMAMVLLSGPINQLRAMVTGRFVLPGDRSDQEA